MNDPRLEMVVDVVGHKSHLFVPIVHSRDFPTQRPRANNEAVFHLSRGVVIAKTSARLFSTVSSAHENFDTPTGSPESRHCGNNPYLREKTLGSRPIGDGNNHEPTPNSGWIHSHSTSICS